MASWIGTIRQVVARRLTEWRRARSLRAGARATLPRAGAAPQSMPPRAPASLRWISVAGVAAAVGGAVLIAAHARQLTASAAGDVAGPGGELVAAAFQPVLPGVGFSVPEQPGVSLAAVAGGALLIAAGMESLPAVRVDLCTQMLDRGRPRLLPLRIGYRFEDVARWVDRKQPGALRNLALSDREMPRLEISGVAVRDFADPAARPLQLAWHSRDPDVRWSGDAAGGRVEQGAAGRGALRRDGWLAWGGSALRIQRRALETCPEAGELVLQLFRPRAAAGAGRALVAAYPALGQPVTAWLAPGRYLVPLAPRPRLEDQALFSALQQHGLVRLARDGMIELAPRDLPAWRAAAAGVRAGELASWDQVKLDAAALGLLKRLYHMADGAYVREQIGIFNSERQLVAWRVAPAAKAADWQASVGAAPVALTGAMPEGAARLFADLPQGWAPWTRIAAWPRADAGTPAQLALTLPQAAAGGETVRLMLAGRAAGVQGARLHDVRHACTGRACPSRDAAQVVTLELLPGARSVTLDVAPLALAPAGSEYRHLRVTAGRLAWHALPAPAMRAPRQAAAEVTLADRHGALLWNDGAPTREALDAGLAPLLGLHAEHASSVAGMLARLPGAGHHGARLTLDLALQTAAQQALGCMGMRRGQWDGRSCTDTQPAPAGRRAGLVIVDTESGDVLAAAGAGAGEASAANWSEVRDFDRANPARSPLRLPALQHDGGAHQSPGSTFKVISALGLELAAQRDPAIEALLGGLPLPAINRMAQQKGFAFQTTAATYPSGTRLAHITNYRDQRVDRRAQAGRFGLEQALAYSLNTWFAWSAELSDRSLFGRADGGAPDLQPLQPAALDSVRPIVGMARRLGFEQPLRLDGGLLPRDYPWSAWDALQASPSHIDPVHTRHELRQMSIGLRMQATPLQMALAAGAVGQGRVVAPRLLLELNGRAAERPAITPLGVRLDRIRAGMKGVIDSGTAASALRDPRLDALRRGLSGKTGTAPTAGARAGGSGADLSTVWFTGWIEPGTLPGQARRLAVAAYVTHSDATGGAHAAPLAVAALAAGFPPKREQKGD